MIVGHKYNLQETVRSNFNNEVYGVPGDEVKLIWISEPVAIVENSKGNRYPLRIEFLTAVKIQPGKQEEIKKDQIKVEKKNNSKPVKRSKKAAPLNTPNLF